MNNWIVTYKQLISYLCLVVLFTLMPIHAYTAGKQVPTYFPPSQTRSHQHESAAQTSDPKKMFHVAYKVAEEYCQKHYRRSVFQFQYSSFNPQDPMTDEDMPNIIYNNPDKNAWGGCGQGSPFLCCCFSKPKPVQTSANLGIKSSDCCCYFGPLGIYSSAHNNCFNCSCDHCDSCNSIDKEAVVVGIILIGVIVVGVVVYGIYKSVESANDQAVKVWDIQCGEKGELILHH